MVGIDILEVERIENSLKKNNNFLNKVCTCQEIEYLSKFKDDFASHLAGFFCAKEAVMKALGTCKKISFLNIEVCHKESGKPYVNLSGVASDVFNDSNFERLEISISQTKKIATAICVLQ